MVPTELELDLDFTAPGGRARRGVMLISASLVALIVAGAVFLHPALPGTGAAAGSGPPPKQGSYRVVAADFVDASTGWVVALFRSGDYAVLRTGDGARSWTQQLTVAGDSHPIYMKFFDRSMGVFALVGTSPVLRRTFDGGRSWATQPALESTAIVTSWSFLDMDYGWMLVDEAASTGSTDAQLYRTEDGGRRWADLGAPVRAPERAYQVHFSYLTTGWLTTSGDGAYAYRTSDLGATWSREQLPAPAAGWPATGQFFVAVQPTLDVGAVASVVYFPPLKGRTGIGGTIRAFPPLTVRGFDGGRPRTFLYATLLDQLVGSPWTQEQAPNQLELGTVDNGVSWRVIAPPSTEGAIGFVNALDWWWVTAGQWSRSRDGGATWSDPRGAGAVKPEPGTLQVLDGKHAWYAGSEDSRPLLVGTDDGGTSWRVHQLPAIQDLPTL
ncbi:MAG TPA: YCF48-related protein [Candidatus Dormibacteraeota bacterium]|nr:YCF48-related protein [Candidatus Dormibacteraeota bacterium]